MQARRAGIKVKGKVFMRKDVIQRGEVRSGMAIGNSMRTRGTEAKKD